MVCECVYVNVCVCVVCMCIYLCTYYHHTHTHPPTHHHMLVHLAITSTFLWLQCLVCLRRFSRMCARIWFFSTRGITCSETYRCVTFVWGSSYVYVYVYVYGIKASLAHT